MSKALLAGAAGLVLAFAAFTPAYADTVQVAQTGDSALPEGFETQPVLKTGRTATDQALSYPGDGNPEITSVLATLQPGGRTSRHQHPVPVYVYVLEGSLSIEYEGGVSQEYGAGEAFMEGPGAWHQAFNRGDTPTRLLIVFLGLEGQPTTETATQ